jgi:hypothetical protein
MIDQSHMLKRRDVMYEAYRAIACVILRDWARAFRMRLCDVEKHTGTVISAMAKVFAPPW